MATFGLAFFAMNGAALFSAASNVSFGDMPGSDKLSKSANSESAQAGLSRKRAI